MQTKTSEVSNVIERKKGERRNDTSNRCCTWVYTQVLVPFYNACNAVVSYVRTIDFVRKRNCD